MGFIYCNVKPIFAKLVEERAFLNKKNYSTKYSNRQIYAIIKV